MTFEEMARARYSVKKYDSTRAVEPEKLERILEVAQLAPTAKNSQSYRIYVVQSDEGLAKMRALTPCTYGAPVVLIFTYEESETYIYPGETEANSGPEDASIVATHVMFEALEQGLGTCWVNRFSPQEVKAAYDIPTTEHVVLLMDVGYAAEGNQPLPNHEKKKAAEEVVRRI